MFEVKIYTDTYKNLWDEFVDQAKNSHFFFKRDYMEYHKDRFKDFSLLIFEGGKLISILPCNIENDIIFSHAGLTFGGFLLDSKIKLPKFLKLFEEVIKFLRKQGIKKIIYKTLPYIFHTLPAEEDRFALYLYDAKLIKRDANSVIYLDSNFINIYSNGKKDNIRKSKKAQIHIEKVRNIRDFETFWHILEEILLKKYNKKPVHSLDEIWYLKNKFPKNIKLFVAKKEEKILAGALIFENKFTVHTQYLANSREGRKLGALDFVIHTLLTDIYKNKKYFSFGISNVEKELNEGLILWKEGFGARTVVHDTYLINL